MFCIGVPVLLCRLAPDENETSNLAKGKGLTPFSEHVVNVQPQRSLVHLCLLMIIPYLLINTGTAQLAWEKVTISASKALVLG